jgi:hypothetical protein
MANVPPAAAAQAPTTFSGVFGSMGDIYGGTYAPLLAEYGPDNPYTAEEVMQRTLTQLPSDQVPAIFVYQDTSAKIRVVHHVHKVEPTIGQPITPLTGTILGFTGEVFGHSAQLIQLPQATFFATTGDIVVPTMATVTALLIASENGMLGPYNPGDPDTEVINTRRAIPIPYAYVPLFTFRTLTAREAWQQVGGQILQDGREQDCRVLLNFLRAAVVVLRGNIRNQPTNPPATTQREPLLPPLDGPLLQHTDRKLRAVLPALFVQQQANEIPAAQTAAIIGQTVAEGFEALRADRALEREANTAAKSFSEQFPANGTAMRRLCQAQNDDDLLPEFWRFYAMVKGKKGPALSALVNFVQLRSREPTSTQVLPIISTLLFTNIASFELGATNVDIITQGVSPFLMCPIGSEKVEATLALSQQFQRLHEGTTLTLENLAAVVPSNDYTIPDTVHTLVDFIGAYSVLWDVLVGEHHPLATALQNHYNFWNTNVRSINTALPDKLLRTVVITGTLRSIQLTVMRYVNDMMYNTYNEVPPPEFNDIVKAVQGRLFQTLPSLPAQYVKLALPPQITHTPTPPTTLPNKKLPPLSNHVTAPGNERHPPIMERFQNSDKSIQQLRVLPGQPKEKRGSGTLCLSYHLRGSCFDNCRRLSTHRKLDKVEIDNFLAFLEKHT